MNAKPAKQRTHSLTAKPHIMDTAWVSGLTAIPTVMLLAYWFNAHDYLQHGISIGNWQLSNNTVDSVLFALLLTIATTAIVESIRVFRFDKSQYFSLDPHLTQKNIAPFLINCLIQYFERLALLFALILFFQTAGEYGFKKHAPFYQPWFRLLELAWHAYIWLGLPYILATRAIHASVENDKKSFSFISWRLGVNPLNNAAFFLRNFTLRLFFAPLACVFFAEHFTTLVEGFSYIAHSLSNSVENNRYRHEQFNHDFVRLSLAFLLCCHVSIASCGYLCISRWVKNDIISNDATFKGWVICLLSYPPFNLALTWYVFVPQDRDFLQLHSDTFVTLLSVGLIVLYTVYVCASVSFGARFSNLTHRGIIQTGLYRWVRHPAYAALTTALWLTALPIIVSHMHPGGFLSAGSLMIGLCLTTGIYYFRAITEEKHLSNDPEYRAYCKKTPRRFFPLLRSHKPDAQ